MGSPMARRLVAAGQKVTVWNRTRRELDGAAVADSPAEAVSGAPIVISMLANPAAVAEVVEAARPGLSAGTIWVEMSTIGPDAVAEVRTLLPDDVRLVDAPVLGTVGPAAEGKLRVIAGGDAADVDRVRDVLGVFGTVHHYGDLGAGAKMKLAVMAGQLSVQVLLAENLAYVRRLGLSTTDYFDLLDATLLGPAGERLRPVVDEGVPETRFKLALAAKDLTLATEGPGEVQTLTAAARDRYAQAAEAGHGEGDVTGIVPALLDLP
ncbi:NAD(P)-dependent oxidoreductase [Herbidospora yilanensis]|uniref:NAD(P)-dependent oxidoreductase n=1 Tax=Herbidospora yilanensis TaxID=354426 RepID=UPI000A00A203|nr:NAD(P)-dependent oxidoreductase [Herbidospora yilanensis]